jgi:serine/threonine protein kinase
MDVQGLREYNALDHLIKSKYKFQGWLGSGTYGLVLKVERRSDGKLFALKIHKKVGAGRAKLGFTPEIEYALMRRLSHSATQCSPYLVCYEEMLYSHGRPVVVMEYLDGRTLNEVRTCIDRYHILLSGMTIKTLCRHLFSALGYLHSHGITHNDLSGNNIMFTKDRMVLIDLGNMCVFNSELAKAEKPQCTLGYYNAKLDVQKLGRFIYELAVGEMYNAVTNDVSAFKNKALGELIRDAASGKAEAENLAQRAQQL